MNNRGCEINSNVIKNIESLDNLCKTDVKLLIVLHNNPDPDALASGFGLKHLVEKRYKVKASIAYGGMIARAENLAMVKILKIPLKNINRIKYSTYDCIAMLDTQPGAGNNSLPMDRKCDLLIDHHPVHRGVKSGFSLIEPDVGSTATMIIEFLVACDIDMPTDLATALAYAIRSETQDLGRETTERDIRAYFTVYTKASMKKLSMIINPSLSHSYYVLLSQTLQHTKIFRHLICTHIGKVPMPEIVAEMADLMLRHKRISWALCTGRFKKSLILSLRTSNIRIDAGKLIKKLVPDEKNAGGHGTFAGGIIHLEKGTKKEFDALECDLSQKFAELMGYENIEWKDFLESRNGIKI